MYGGTFQACGFHCRRNRLAADLLPPRNATGNFVKVVQRIPVKILLDPIPPDKAFAAWDERRRSHFHPLT